MYRLEIINNTPIANSEIDCTTFNVGKNDINGILHLGNKKIGVAWKTNIKPEILEIQEYDLLAVALNFSVLLFSIQTGDLELKIGLDHDFVQFKVADYNLLIVTDLRIVIINLNSLSINKVINIPDNIIDTEILNERIKIITLSACFEVSLF